MLRRLYDWTITLGQSRYALMLLAVVAFVESSIFPIPPDALMIPMIIAAPRRAFLIAGICTASSVLGGAFGYYIWAELFDNVGEPVLNFYHKTEQFEALRSAYNEQGFWAVLVAGVTPFPYKVITILSGATGLNFGLFMATSLFARSLRFFVIAVLLWKFGPPIKDFIERRLGLMFIIAVTLLIGGFLLVRFL